MRYLILSLFSASIIFSSCSSNSNRFVSYKTSKKAVNIHGNAYSETIGDLMDKSPEHASKTDFQGASGPGTGRSIASGQYAQEKLKRRTTPTEVADQKNNVREKPVSEPKETSDWEDYYEQEDLNEDPNSAGFDYEEDVEHSDRDTDGQARTNNSSTEEETSSDEWGDEWEEETDVEHLPW
ncbi:MAG: hypothetical protein ACK4ND_06230 [Cytophagaceae bacterium]